MKHTFSHVFEMEKEAGPKMDYLRMLGRATKESLVGSHGLKGMAEIAKHPVKAIKTEWSHMPLWMKGLMGVGVAGSAFGEGGPMQRIGRVTGNVLPIGFMGMAPGANKAPGVLGGMLGQEVLGGGMFVNKGILERAGEGVDKFLGFGKTPKSVAQKATTPPPIANERTMNTSFKGAPMIADMAGNAQRRATFTQALNRTEK